MRNIRQAVVAALVLHFALALPASAQIIDSRAQLLERLAGALTIESISREIGADGGTWPVAIRNGILSKAAQCLGRVPNDARYSNAIKALNRRPSADALVTLSKGQIEADRRSQSLTSGDWAHIACLQFFSGDLKVAFQQMDGDFAAQKRAYREYALQHPKEPWPWRALVALVSQNPTPDSSVEAIEAGKNYLGLSAKKYDQAEASAALADLYIRLDQREESGLHAKNALEIAEAQLATDPQNVSWMRLAAYASHSISTNSWNSALATAEADAQRAVLVAERYSGAVGDLEAQCILYDAYFNMGGVLSGDPRGASFKAKSEAIAREGGFYGKSWLCPTVEMLAKDRSSGQRIDVTP